METVGASSGSFLGPQNAGVELATPAMTRATEYLYSSARIRSMENALLTGERTERLLEMRSSAEVLASLADCGFVPRHREDGSLDREATLQSVLSGAYETVLDMIPDRRAIRFLMYPYDCNNIKAAIKAFLRGIDPTEMLYDMGTVAPEAVVKMPEAQSFESLPRHMAEAAGEALLSYSRTQDPQCIDLLLDRACYEDMLEFVLAGRSDYAIRLVRTKIDLTNLMILLRLLRMGSGRTGETLLANALLSGGTIPAEDLHRWYKEGESRLWDAVSLGCYAPLAKSVQGGNTTLAGIECAADDVFMETVRAAKMIPFGYEVVIGYLYGVEYEVRNVRILLSGKDAGLPSDVLRMRMRRSYV